WNSPFKIMGKHYGLDIPTLSELLIDTDKEWVDEDGQPRGISNIKEVAQAMATGHIGQCDGTRLLKLPPSMENYVLTSQGPGHLVAWTAGGTYFHRFFPVCIDLSHAEAIVTPDESYDKDAPLTTWDRETYGDAPGDYIKRLTPAVALVDTEAIVVPDQTHQETPSITAAPYSWKKVVDGAVADDGGVETDETGKAQDAVTDDMTLLPVCTNGGLVAGDAYYFGFAYLW
ncbi:unnamed protein product, partial [marine sediment metagenome]